MMDIHLLLELLWLTYLRDMEDSAGSYTQSEVYFEMQIDLFDYQQ